MYSGSDSYLLARMTETRKTARAVPIPQNYGIVQVGLGKSLWIERESSKPRGLPAVYRVSESASWLAALCAGGKEAVRDRGRIRHPLHPLDGNE
jgi:hypothetical protein